MVGLSRSASSSEMIGNAGARCASPSRMMASAASSAAVTGEPSALMLTRPWPVQPDRFCRGEVIVVSAVHEFGAGGGINRGHEVSLKLRTRLMKIGR